MTCKLKPCVLLGWLVACLAAPAVAEDWPTYRHDSQRSGISVEQITPPLSEEWVFTPALAPSHAWGDPQTKPVEKTLELPRMRFDDAFHVAVAGERVFFGSSSDNKIYALDAKTGEIRWESYTDGPVRLAPTVWKDKVYAGSDDGKVYCLDAGDGHPIWTFDAAPCPEKLLGNGKLISPWPVRTGVLVEDSPAPIAGAQAGGVAYFGAGVFPAEGLYLYAVNAEDGKLLWRNDSYGQGGMGTVSPQGYLLASKDKLFVPSGRAMPAAFARKDGRFLFHRNISWRDYGLFGGAQSTLAGDLLFNGTEQIVAVNENDGRLVLTEGIPAIVPTEGQRQVAVDGDVIYLLTGKEAIALDRPRWIAIKKPMTTLKAQVSALTRRRTELNVQARTNKELLKQVAEVQARLDDAVAQLKTLEPRQDEATKWRTPCEGSDSVLLARGTLFVGGSDVVMGLETPTGKNVWSAAVNGKARGLALADGRLLVSTDKGGIHCFLPGSAGRSRKVSPRIVADPFPKDALTDFYAKTAEAIVKDGGARQGYALILGGGVGRLALELSRRTDLLIYMVEPDANQVAAARRALTAAGAYGGKVVVAQAPLDALPYADYFANLVVCEGGFFSQAPPVPAEEVLRMLKPCGGVAYVGRPAGGVSSTSPAPAGLPDWLAKLRKALDALGEAGTKVTVEGNWAKITRGALPGAGSWTHEYAEPGNTACGDDRLVRGPLDILWFGEPGPERMLSRHASGAAPLAFGGRMFIQGQNVILAYDAYNGLPLWERSIPGASRGGLTTGCSNLAAADDGIFVVAGGACLRLDAATGKTLSTYPVPAEDQRRHNWAYVASAGGLLYGSSDANRVFALEVGSGRLRWAYDGQCILHNTICIGDGRVFLVDRSVTKEQQEQCLAGIGPEMRVDSQNRPIRPDVRLVVALNAQTGKKEWDKPQYVSDCVKVGPSGGELTAMYARNVLLLCAQPWNGHFWKEFLAGGFSRRSLIALAGDTGRELWSGRKGYRSRPLIVGDRIIAEPWAYDLKTGAEQLRAHPVTGAEAKWQLARPGHHCGNIAAAPNTLFFRSGVTGFYDLLADYGTVHFGAQRPGCWINCIPANGLVMMPEASSGCVCPFAIQCTVVFQPRKTSRAWGVFSAPGPMTPVKRLALNFGAPGDRKDSSGTLWLAYPRLRSDRLLLNVKLETEVLAGGGFFCRNADFLKLDGTAEPWIYASGWTGLARCTIPLAEAGGPARGYTVRLHFAEIEDVQPGQRVFDVKLQEQTVLKDFDIVKEAGGRLKALVKEFRNVQAGDRLTVELAPKARPVTAAAMPILSGLEIVAEKDVNR